MQKHLIINADDFGMSKEVNEGTKLGIKRGLITSVSVMANMPLYNDAIVFLRKNPRISVGLHFNITEGSPLILPKDAKNLIREDNFFYHWPNMLARVSIGSILITEIEKELRAQYDKLKSSGLRITHIDSHHHVHLHPHIFKVVSKFADDHKINSLRGSYFSPWNLTLGVWKKPITTQTLVNSMLLLVNMRHFNRKLPYSIDRFYDINWGKNLTEEEFIKVLKKLPLGTTEFICHIALPSQTGNKKFLKPRYEILKLLSSKKVKQQLLERDIMLIPYQKEAVRIQPRPSFIDGQRI